MNDLADSCNYHPDQLLVGVCPLCLHEKLLIIADIQDRRSHSRHRSKEDLQLPSHSRKPSNGGLLAIGSFLSRLELRRSCRRSDFRQSCDLDDDAGSGTHSDSSSLEDSYISIKFEEHGAGSWNANAATNSKTLYKESSVGGGSIRWRKRIGQLLQLVKKKRFKNPNGDSQHDSSVAGLGEIVKVMNMK